MAVDQLSDEVAVDNPSAKKQDRVESRGYVDGNGGDGRWWWGRWTVDVKRKMDGMRSSEDWGADESPTLFPRNKTKQKNGWNSKFIYMLLSVSRRFQLFKNLCFKHLYNMPLRL
jgi:hypothetical protein